MKGNKPDTDKKASKRSHELTDEQIAEENKFLEGLPRVNWGAFFMPPVWGAVNGMVAAILFYPAWLLADNCIYAAVQEPNPLNVGIAVLLTVSLLAVMVMFAIVSQPIAAHKAEARGVDRETYLKRQRIWAVVCFLLAVALVAFATYYNINVRPVMEAEQW